MSFNRSLFDSLIAKGKAKSALLALSIGLAVGFAGGHALHSKAETSPGAVKEQQSVSIPVHSGKKKDAEESDTKNRFHRSIPRQSLSTPMFDPWWRTMMHDPYTDWFMSRFDPMMTDFDGVMPARMGSFMPRLDTSDEGDSIKITAEVPGIDEKNLDVTVTDDVVTIKGEKNEEHSDSTKSDKNLQTIERSYGSFQRTVSLPCTVQSDKAEASLKNGLLTITVPKSHVAQTPAKKLTIRTQ